MPNAKNGCIEFGLKSAAMNDASTAATAANAVSERLFVTATNWSVKSWTVVAM
jgi:hypothetical protein